MIKILINIIDDEEKGCIIQPMYEEENSTEKEKTALALTLGWLIKFSDIAQEDAIEEQGTIYNLDLEELMSEGFSYMDLAQNIQNENDTPLEH